MTNVLQTIFVLTNQFNYRNLFAKALFLACAFVACACLSTTAKAQNYLPVETQVYLDLARVCLQRGDDYCALKSLQNAARISPQLARDPQLVQIARILYARVESRNHSGSSGSDYTPGRRSRESWQSLINTFKNPYLN